MKQPFKGLHKVKKRLASGKFTTYYYAYRGGPRIDAEYGSPEFCKAFAELARKPRQSDKGTLAASIRLYLTSPKFKALAESTKIEYRRHLDRIRMEFGQDPLEYFNDNRTRRLIYVFRDRYADTPRTADHLVTVFSALLSFLVDQSVLQVNVAAGMTKLHRSNRADIIWSDAEIDAVCKFASQELAWAIRLEALTGMRTGDLITVPWTAVQDHSIDWKTSKRGVRVQVPITDPVRSLLLEIPKSATTILTNTKGLPWTKGGLKTMFGRAKKSSGIQGKRFHDLRGTAATKLILAGLTDLEVASIIGWSPNRVTSIRAMYVDNQRIISNVIERIARNETKTNSVN